MVSVTFFSVTHTQAYVRAVLPPLSFSRHAGAFGVFGVNKAMENQGIYQFLRLKVFLLQNASPGLWKRPEFTFGIRSLLEKMSTVDIVSRDSDLYLMWSED